YLITEPNFRFPRGDVQLVFAENSFKNADSTPANAAPVTGAGNDAATLTFTVEGASAVISDPGAGGSIDINVLNNPNYIDVRFTAPTNPAGLAIDVNSITDLTPEFALSGSGLGTVRLDDGRAPVLLTTQAGTLTFRYWLTGEFAPTGTVTLTYLAGSWSF